MRSNSVKAWSVSFLLCLVFALAGSLLVGDALTTWYPTLRQPWFALPLQGWLVVGMLYYLICLVISYRLLTRRDRPPGYGAAFALFIVMMAMNEGWNYLLFVQQNLGASLIGLLIFCVVAIGLFLTLHRFDRIAALILLPYVVDYGQYAA
jgi:tryptophan-rich sensory protein